MVFRKAVMRETIHIKRHLFFFVMVVFALLALPVQGFSSDTSLMLDSEPYDFLGGGIFRFFSSTSGTFTAERNSANGVSISFMAPDDSHWWDLIFKAPDGGPLAAGVYPVATENPYAFNLDVSGDGRACNVLTGNFRVKDIRYGPASSIMSFWATFELQCENQPPILRGEVRYNTDAPNTVTAIQPSSDPSRLGQLLTLKATVASGRGTPSGTVTFMEGTTFLGTGVLSGKPATATIITSKLPVGMRRIRAVYNGSGSFESSTSAVLKQVVEKSGATILIMDSDPYDWVGQGLYYFSSLDDGVFDADIESYDNSMHIFFRTFDNSYWSRLSFAAADGAPLAVGTYWGAGDEAHHPGKPGLSVSIGSGSFGRISGGGRFEVLEIERDEDYKVLSFRARFEQTGSVGLRGEVRFKAHAPNSATVVSSSLNPSADGQTVVFTATVGGDGGIPRGTVTFKDGTKVLGTGVLSGNPATATFSAKSLAKGKHRIRAIYDGNATFPSSSSWFLIQTVR
jgi:hypothetical protein